MNRTIHTLSTDKKALKAGGLQLALAGVAVAPTDEVDSTREYELVAIGFTGDIYINKV